MSRGRKRPRKRSLEKLAPELEKLGTALEKACRLYGRPDRDEDAEDAIRMNIIRVHEAMNAIRKMEQDFWQLFCEGTDLNLKDYRRPLAHGGEISPDQLQELMERFIEPLCVAIRLTVIAEQDPQTGKWSGIIGGERFDEWKRRINKEEHTLKKKATLISLTPEGRFDVLRIGMSGEKGGTMVDHVDVYSGRKWRGRLAIYAR